MDLVQWWRRKRLQRRIHRLGRDCQILGKYIELKGRVILGDRCILGENLVLRTHKHGQIVLGDDVEISDNVIIQCNQEFKAGAGTVIREFCVIRDTHHVVYGTELHWRLSPHNTAAITIGPNCYIGAHTYLGPGVSVGEGAAIAPGSLVTRSIGPWEIWAGRPARLMANRKTGEIFAKLKQHLELVSMFGVAPDSGRKDEPAALSGGPEKNLDG
jgi:acetyltransferase-like isoleucine patch superfamily enzyme